MRPLEGIIVVSLEHAIAAPFCTRHLADLGARVIKVERPTTGDFARDYDHRVRGLSSHFVWVNRSKESLALNLKDPKDLSDLKKLLRKADVLVQNLAPGASDRLGLSYEDLRSANRRLIVCDISGYGSDGPYGGKKAYDLLIQGEAGFLSVTGKDGEVVKAGCSIADIAAGIYAYSNILGALISRNKTGEGCRIEISMLECMVEWMGYPLYYAFEGAEPPPLTGASHASIYPYGPFKTKDGHALIIGVQNEREWISFCRDVINRADLTTDDRFNSNTKRSSARDQLNQIIVPVISSLAQQELLDRLDRATIGHAGVNTMHDVWNHPQLRARKRWVAVDSSVGKIPALLPPGIPAQFSPPMGPIPRVGQHNSAIYSEFIDIPSAMLELDERNG